ncbi:MAG: DUF4388 domain-containing protein [Ktedonobacterales bacterium]
MPLSGNLRQFALPDVLRVIESGQRSGRLVLQRGERRAAIYFSGGQWLMAERIGSQMVLAHHLARVGLITPEQFESALGVPFGGAGEISDMQLVRTLVSSRMLTQEQLRQFAFSDGVNLLAQVLAWPDGEFVFEDGVTLPQGRVWLPLPLGPLVSKALGLARGNLPSREVVPLAPEAVVDFAEVDPESGTAIQLNRTQWKLLTAVDGQIPLWAISQKLNAPEATILRLAAELVAGGTIVIVGRYAQVSE